MTKAARRATGVISGDCLNFRESDDALCSLAFVRLAFDCGRRVGRARCNAGPGRTVGRARALWPRCAREADDLQARGRPGRRHRGLFRAGEAAGQEAQLRASRRQGQLSRRARRRPDRRSVDPARDGRKRRALRHAARSSRGRRRTLDRQGRAARGPHDLLPSGHARRRRPLLDLFAQPGAQPGRVPRRVADRAGRRHGPAGRNAARSEGRERHCHRAARSRGGHVQPSAVRQHLRLRSRDGQEQPFLRARQSARALPLLSAGTARRRMAGVDAGKGGHRSGGDREVRPEADRHATGQCQHLARSTAC